MQELPLAYWLGVRAAMAESRSALPDAPVIPYGKVPARGIRTRRAATGRWHRLANAIGRPSANAVGRQSANAVGRPRVSVVGPPSPCS